MFQTGIAVAADHAPAVRSRIRRWARVSMAAHVVFVAAFLIAASWQGPRYSVTAHSISDMYAQGAPHAAFLIVVNTCCGAAGLLFVSRSLWPVLRPAGGLARLGCVLFSLAPFGVGDLLTPFERLACRQADPECSASDQLANSGGTMDNLLTSVGMVAMVAGAFVLASAMKRLPRWAAWVRPVRLSAAVLLLLLVATVLSGPAGLDGLFERLVAGFGAACVIALGAAVLREGA
ncbi:DUF998 domain-containing protein [Streptomyces sp. NBC_00448]|uniref:DUF998 domain-containing protein n=1 Tax=Streptomyces sp. NBC_00448 TaxID=2903652 RepID=UPI002E1A87D0